MTHKKRSNLFLPKNEKSYLQENESSYDAVHYFNSKNGLHNNLLILSNFVEVTIYKSFIE